MLYESLFQDLHPALLAVLIIAMIWELIWKGFALWKSAKNNHVVWFVFILLINSVGILPIVYLIFTKNKKVGKKKIKS